MALAAPEEVLVCVCPEWVDRCGHAPPEQVDFYGGQREGSKN